MMSYWGQFARTGSPGRGKAGDLPEWLPFDSRANPDDMILDTTTESGIRMANAFETRDGIPEEIDADPRLPTQLDKCRVFHELVGFTRGIKKSEYPTAGKVGCAAYPYDQFPWQ